jgi:UDP-N-acetylmuramoyl-tripeptide--D-alanyl-D-alanine ligase
MEYISIEELYARFQETKVICTDTRKITPGSIFFALSGPSFNGNTFARQALEGGCKYAVVDQAEVIEDERYLLVNDSLKALQLLARHHRRQCESIIIGVTGSNGKTTTKELLAAVLRKKYNTLATQGNLNNQIGVPLTLLSMPANTEIAVIEMGASKPGDIQELVEIAEPNYGLITNIGKAHLEGMGGYDGVVKTKTELYDFIRNHGGKVFVNGNHPVFTERSLGMDTIVFGNSDAGFVQGQFVDSNPFVRFFWNRVGEGNLADRPMVNTQIMGYYNYENLLAAATVGAWFNVPDAEINEALESYVPENNRSQWIETGKNLLILDAYNANPTSMEAALTNFKTMERTGKVLVLGKMMELGEGWENEHFRIAELANQTGAEAVYLIGDLYRKAGVSNATRIFDQVEEAIVYFTKNPLTGKCILVKGSRSNKLELLRPLM